jgi:hypothetical protein
MRKVANSAATEEAPVNPRMLTVVALLGCSLLATADEGSPVLQTSGSRSGVRISYEDFAALSTQARLEVFNRMSPDGKANLSRTHLQRWRDANKSRLSETQLEFIDLKAIPSINADIYKRPRAEEKALELKQMEEEAHQLFERADVSAAFHLIGIRGGPDTPDRP